MQRSGSAALGRGSIRSGSVRVVKSGSGRPVEEVVVNKNVTWVNSPAVWVVYISTILFVWLAATAVVGPGLAWTYVHLIHGAVTYYLLHWIKGSPDAHALNGGKYAGLTIWEQLDNGTYGTVNRKLLTIVPVVLFLLASHGTELTKQPVGLNLAVAVLILFAKLPYFHKVRIFGIGK